MIPTYLPALTNHLWQSTLFAAMVGLVVWGLRENRASVRYWLWLAASFKFLVPFTLLISIGSQFEWHGTSSIGPPSVSPAVAEMGQTIISPAVGYSPSPQQQASSVVPAVLLGIWVCGSAVWLCGWLRAWLRIRATLRAASPVDLTAIMPSISIRVMSAESPIEPGVVGIFHPVLLLPEGITDRLTPRHLRAVVVHELCHVRRRDNLTGAIHMAVEALFWFHPLLLWIGRRLVAERERACDEEVLRTLGEPYIYAEGILNVCKFYHESTLRCVSGVTGADLKERIRRITSESIGDKLTFTKKAALSVAGIVTLAVPMLVGSMNASPIRAGVTQSTTTGRPKFEVASIRLNKDCRGLSGGVSPGRMTLNCQSVAQLIRTAYGAFANGYPSLPPLPTIEGGPSWIYSERYDIDAKAEGNVHAWITQGPMLQVLLEDRIKLKIRRETREVPVYALTVTKSGSKLKPSKEGSCILIDPTKGPTPPPNPGQKPRCGQKLFRTNGPTLTVEMLATSLDEFARFLELDRPVVDKTGMTGRFDFNMEFVIDETTPKFLRGGGLASDDAPGATDRPIGASFFTAVQEQLGLRLDAAKGPGEFLIIERAEKPSEN
jgi:bla regulator protein BlaR1